MPARGTRLVAGAATVLLAALGLTACAASSGAPAGCTPQASAGAASASVRAPGAVGTKPTVRFSTPLHADTTQVSTITAGHGAVVGSTAQAVTADVTLLDGTTGKVLQATPYTGVANAATFVIRQFQFPGIRKALVCARAGERLAAVVAPGEVVAKGQRLQGVASGDSVVAVVDVRRVFLARADGADQVMGDGLPAVVLGPDGRPGVTLPEGAPPKAARVADLKSGSGAVVHAGDTVVVQYTGVGWNPGDPSNGTVFGSSWTSGTPTTITVDAAQTGSGLVKALTGRRIGSQVLAVLPPAQATGSQTVASPPSGSTGVFVIDLLGKV